MSTQVSNSRGQHSSIAAGRVQRTQVEVKEFGNTVNISKGNFHHTNFIIRNTQGKNLRQYWYVRGLINIFLIYFFAGLFSFFHVGAASAAIVLDILWILLFSQYMYIASTVIPIVVKHPVLPALQTINWVNTLLEVQVKVVDGRYIYLNTVDIAGLQVGNVEVQYKQADTAGLVVLSETGGTIRFQVLSPRARNEVVQTQVFSFLLLLGAIFHLFYAIACFIGVLAASKGGASSIFNNDNSSM
uniref:Uncharacterized protein n=1 Tax=Amphimedon queenslandica TaxID=400682 RepID=A0A1X7TS06_AMPQE